MEPSVNDLAQAKTADVNPRRRPKVERREETIAKILDAAEGLFAGFGLHGVTIKDVAKAAGVDTALIHYYFGNKVALFDAVFGRRAVIINDMRLNGMRDYAEAAGDALTIEGVLAAFLDPTFLLLIEGDPGWRNYAALVAQVNNTPAWGGATMRDHFDPVVAAFIALLRRLSPKTPDENLFWYYHLLSGALTLSLAQTGRIDALSGGLCKSTDMAPMREQMISVFAAGFSPIRR
jgi:AcrR family transcriptional regulator